MMTPYQLKTFLQHRLKSKGRHGTHSPLIYRLVEVGLKPVLGPHEQNMLKELDNIKTVKWPRLKWALFLRLLLFFNPKNWSVIAMKHVKVLHYFFRHWQFAFSKKEATYYETFIYAEAPEAVREPAEGYHDKTAILINGIYKNKAATAAWKELREDANVSASVDLWHFGLLLFDTSFREKQDFKLRFPA